MDPLGIQSAIQSVIMFFVNLEPMHFGLYFGGAGILCAAWCWACDHLSI